jgi:hypothetical protein
MEEVYQEDVYSITLSTTFFYTLQIKDVTRQIRKTVSASTFQELLKRSSEKFGRSETPKIHLDSDGTEIDDEDYFQTLEPNTELIALFSGEQWIDVSPHLNLLILLPFNGKLNYRFEE